MALYKWAAGIAYSDDAAFDKEYEPGQKPDRPGIYRCKGCGREVVGEDWRMLPPQKHHQHTQSQGPVIWRLSVFAQT
jgi:hypothetical protein